MHVEKIGWIGMGKMGVPMSKRLADAGYDVTAYNRTDGKNIPAVKTAGSPAELIQKTDIVFIMVSDDLAIRQVFGGANGLLEPRMSGKTIINMSTVSPSISLEMAALCELQGNSYLDAPVSGSVKQAEDATLVIMVGGRRDAYEKTRPILEKIGRMAIRVGGTGAGNTAKLVINTLLGVYAQGLAEAFDLAVEKGLKAEDLSILLNNSALGSPLMKLKGDQILAGNFKPMFALKHLAKDLRLAKDLGLSQPLGLAAYQTFQEAEPVYAEEDIIAIVKQLGKHQNMESNKQIIRNAFDAWANGTANFFDLLAEDVQWTIAGNTPLSRTFTSKQDFVDGVLKPVNDRLSKRITPNVTGIYADGDMVVVLWNGQATTLAGEPFNLSYSWNLQLTRGKITKATAFLDGVAYNAFLQTPPSKKINS